MVCVTCKLKKSVRNLPRAYSNERVRCSTNQLWKGRMVWRLSKGGYKSTIVTEYELPLLITVVS